MRGDGRHRRGRHPGGAVWLRDDEGSMSLLLMVVVVGLALSALLVPMVISQNRSTRFDNTRVQSLGAAQAGIDVALGLIRGANSVDTKGASYGDSTKLPCGPLSGIATGPGAAAYSVKIEYFTFDPIREPDASKRSMNCVAGYGVYDPTAAVYTPGFARITSTGTVGTAVNGSSAGRTLVTTYVFKTTNTTIVGGSIQISPTNSTVLCMDAGSATAPAATAVVLRTCSTSSPPSAQQSFTYRTDLTLQLMSSVNAINPNGLCLAPSATPPAATNAIQLAQCGALGQPPYQQQWSYSDAGKYQASVATSKADGVLPDLCISATGQSVGVPLMLMACGSSAQWIPSPSVGPGGAALPQWVNSGEAGRCLDVTNGDVNSTYLIDYPCKQNPNPNAVSSNQKFYAPAIGAGQTSVTGQIYTTVTAGGTKYCLTSPGTNIGRVTLGPTGTGGVQACGSGGATQTWTIYGGDKSLAQANKYTVVDNTGLCLGLDSTSSGWSVIDVETCTGAADQKWNVGPNVVTPALQNTREK
jgi:Ricin-type beta-trefoil lectin domain